MNALTDQEQRLADYLLDKISKLLHDMKPAEKQSIWLKKPRNSPE